MSVLDQSLLEFDPDVAELIGRELERQRTGLEMIASENHAPLASCRRRARCSPTSTRRATRAGACGAGIRGGGLRCGRRSDRAVPDRRVGRGYRELARAVGDLAERYPLYPQL
jgi:hypothetical protein